MGQSLNIIPDFQYMKGVVLYITTAQLVHDYSELILFFRQLQPAIQYSNYPFFITPIWSYTG